MFGATITDQQSCNPILGETPQGIFDAESKGFIDFDCDPWPVMSDSANDLIRRMLNPRPGGRLTQQMNFCVNFFHYFIQMILFYLEYLHASIHLSYFQLLDKKNT